MSKGRTLFFVIVLVQALLLTPKNTHVLGVMIPLALLYFVFTYRSSRLVILWLDGVLAGLIISIFLPQQTGIAYLLSWFIACGVMSVSKSLSPMRSSYALGVSTILVAVVIPMIVVDSASGREIFHSFYGGVILVIAGMYTGWFLLYHGLVSLGLKLGKAS